MADGYWNRQQPMVPSAGIIKRPRVDYALPPSGLPSGHEMHNYLPPGDDRGGPRAKDTTTIGSAYDRYLQNVKQNNAYTSGDPGTFGGGGVGRSVGGRTLGVSVADPSFLNRPGAVDHDLARAAGLDRATNGRTDFGGLHQVEAMTKPSRETAPLPPDATNTLYVEGLPSDTTKREVAHIFRPFVGYKEVRLVTKESKHRHGDPLVLCFVDFANPACAATAMSAIQGYKMDEHDQDSHYLRLQFSRFPGPRSGGSGSRGRR